MKLEFNFWLFLTIVLRMQTSFLIAATNGTEADNPNFYYFLSHNNTYIHYLRTGNQTFSSALYATLKQSIIR